MALVALLACWDHALAGPILRRGGGGAGPSAAAPAAAEASAVAQEAAAAARRASSALTRARDAARAFQAAQESARAVQGASGDVPDGLGAGGLQVDPAADADPSLWQGADRPTQGPKDGKLEVTVRQRDPKAILGWETFNVGAGTILRFDQSAGADRVRDWVVLNRVADPAGRPSRILGSILAGGQVFVVNRNGIVFGATSQVNTGALLASSLDFEPWAAAQGSDLARRNAAFAQGVLQSAFRGEAPGAIAVEAGARITASGYGQAVLLGGQVTSAGTLEAPDGQVILGSGSFATLRPRVGNRFYELALAPQGTTLNAGILSTPRGSISLAGAEVQQAGLLQATTGAEAGGSILVGSDGFRTRFAPGSVTQILPDAGGKKVVGDGVFTPSQVQVVGKEIRFQEGSVVYVPGGSLEVGTALRVAGAPASQRVPDDVRIVLDPGASLDVSGLRDVEVPMEQNAIRAELRASELADNPVLRGSRLRGATVWFDARLGVGGVARLGGYYDLVERDVSQLMTRGGTVKLVGSEILLRQGSAIDLSGGSLRTLGGWLRSSELLTETGTRVRIEEAVAGERYVGLAGDFLAAHPRWGGPDVFRAPLRRSSPRFVPGYLEGKAAGALILDTNVAAGTGVSELSPDPEGSPTGAFRILDGELRAGLVVGPHQHELPGQSDAARRSASRGRSAEQRERPAGARLQLLRSGDVTIADGPALLPPGFQPGDPLDEALRYQHRVPLRWLEGLSAVQIASGFSNDWTSSPTVVQVAPGGTLTLPAGAAVHLADGGSFSFTGKEASLDGAIVAPGGSVSLAALDAPCTGAGCGPLLPAHPSRIRLGPGAVLDVAGRFTNEVRADGPRRALDGGQVRLEAPAVVLEPGSRLDASGGARLEASGTRVTGGKGGSLAIDLSSLALAADGSSTGGLTLGGTLAGYGVAAGGSLSLSTPFAVEIADAMPAGAPAGAWLLTPDLFTRGGFSSYAIRAGRSLTVAAGTLLAPSAEALFLPERAADLAGGTRLTAVASRSLLPAGQRAPMALSLSALPRQAFPDDTMGLAVGAGAEIRMEPGSSVTLAGNAEVRVDGAIRVPGGRITLQTTEVELLSRLRESRVALGPEARLLAPGYRRETVEGELLLRSVRPGGAIALSVSGLSSSPYPDGDLQIASGALLDVSGVAGPASLLSGPAADGVRSRYQEAPVDGAAGTISLRSHRGGEVAGSLLLRPGGPAGAGGTLSIDARGIPVVLGDAGPVASALAVASRAASDSGADELSVAAPLVRFDGDVALTARRAIALLTPQLGTGPGAGGTAAVRARHVSLSGGGRVPTPALAPASPTSRLSVEGDLIDLAGTIQLGCGDGTCGAFGEARFAATGDIRLTAGDTAYVAGFLASGLVSPGAITFSSAQTYVTTRARSNSPERAAEDPGYLVLSAAAISVAGNGGPAPAPLSFGERLTLRAPVIVQGGVLRAPQGQLRLEGVAGPGGEGSVTLLPGSLTSASLEGRTVLFGDVEKTGFQGYSVPGAAPAKAVVLQAGQVRLEPGAVLDVSGGGDLLGYAFREGNGGTRDVLAAAGAFAILPGSLGGGPAPVDKALSDPGLRAGDSVYLQGVPGLPAGRYTLLPAHYALLPGGLLVRPLANPRGTFLAGAPEAWVKADGTVVVGGYRTSPGGVADPGWSRFELLDPSVFLGYSELASSRFTDFARALAAEAKVPVRTPADAGSAVLAAGSSLELGGTGRFGAGGGQLGQLDISATRIAVGAPRSGFVTLAPAALSGFGAGSLLLGGVRSAEAGGGTRLTVNALEVAVDGSASLAAPEILLAAREAVTIADGAVVRAEGGAPGDPGRLLLAGEGALARLSAGGRAETVRAGAAGLAGDLRVGRATLVAAGSLSLDGTRVVELAPGVSLRAAQLDLASTRVLLGDAPAGAQGTRLDAALLEALGASDLLLRGGESIQIHPRAGGEPLALGGRDAGGARTLARLTLDAPLVTSPGSASVAARIAAGELTLRSSGAPAAAGPAGEGILALDVDLMALGPGEVRLGGLQGDAGAIEARGAGGLGLAGSLSLRSGQLSAGTGVAYAVAADGAVALSGLPSAGTPAPVAALGARLELRGATVELDTRVLLPAGTLEATATGGALRLGSGAALDVRGAQRDFVEVTRFAPGGTIVLTAATDLQVAGGAWLDVSGSAGGGDAGRIELQAAGRAAVEGELRGRAGSQAWRGGSFRLDAGTADFPALNRRLEAGGLDDRREVRLRLDPAGIRLDAGEQLRAHRVVLHAGAGAIHIAGRIDASGGGARPEGGLVELAAAGDLSLTGVIDARAGAAAPGGFAPASGRVELSSLAGSIALAPGAVLDLSGGRDGGGGLVVRAPRRGASDLAVDRLESEVRGARHRVLQGLRSYEGATTVDAALAAALLGDASTWLAGAPSAVAGRLGATGWTVAPAMRVAGPGGLAVAADLDLHALAAPGWLGLQAGGDLTVGAGLALSDGFAGAARGAALLDQPSFGLALESGGDLRLAAGALVRTGSGSIAARAGRDLVLEDARAVLYTAGRHTTAAPGYAAPTAADGVGALPLGELPTQGGDLELQAGRDVRAALPTQASSAWLYRYGVSATAGSPGVQTSWSVVTASFEQGVAALGGGDVRVRAGRDVIQLDVAIPTTGHLTTPMAQVGAAADLAVTDHGQLPSLVLRGGGSLELLAGRDVRGGLFLLGRGHADVRAGGGILRSLDLVGLRNASGSPGSLTRQTVGVLFGLMDATATATAASTVEVQAAFDPMRQGQVAANLSAGAGSSFWGYSERAALDATSLAGEVRYGNDPYASVDPSLAGPAAYRVSMASLGTANFGSLFLRAPPTLRLASLESAVPLVRRFTDATGLTLEPAARGTLEILAGTDVRIRHDLRMEDVAPAYRYGPLAPFAVVDGAASLTNFGDLGNNLLRGPTPIHAGDPGPVRIQARDGSVCAYLSGGCTRSATGASLQATLTFPKPVQVSAGRDVVAGSWLPQHGAAGDLTWLRAGRDLREVSLQVTGPGLAVVEAGRDIVLSASSTGSVTAPEGGQVVSRGDNVRGGNRNLALPAAEAASLLLLAGTAAGVDEQAFSAAYLGPAAPGGVVRSYLPELRAYLVRLGRGELSGDALLAAFQGLPPAQRRAFAGEVLMRELRETGIDYTDPESPRFRSYDRGFLAIRTLFPGDPGTLPAEGAGSVLLNGKPVGADAAADVTILAPYGRVLVGNPALDTGRADSGVVTRRGGDVRLLALRNIDLETSRVFTLQGGDITMWSSQGSITAGTGSKTSVFQAPLSYNMSGDGVVTLNAFGISTGAGIGVLDALQDPAARARRSRLDLIAPRGEVNSGDAGIRVVGDLNIAAQVVVGQENIQVSGGKATGLPQVQATGGAAAATAGQVMKAAADEGLGPSAAAAQKTLAELPSIITVEVVGYELGDRPEAPARPAGEEDARKRQSAPAPETKP